MTPCIAEGTSAMRSSSSRAPWHLLNFFPLPQGQGSFRPTFFGLANSVKRSSGWLLNEQWIDVAFDPVRSVGNHRADSRLEASFLEHTVYAGKAAVFAKS